MRPERVHLPLFSLPAPRAQGVEISVPLLCSLLALLSACQTPAPSPLVIPAPIPLGSPGEPADPRFEPAIESLSAAVNEGDDVHARAILDRLLQMHPTGRALELARGYEKILDGRAAQDAVSLQLAADLVQSRGAPETAVASLLVQSSDERITELHPGPATLELTLTSVDAQGNESRATDRRSFDALSTLAVGHADPTRVELARFPVALPKNAVALRLVFTLELRSGSVRADGRDLPAHAMRVGTTELVLLAKELAREGLAQPGDLAALALRGTCTRRAALEVAVRVPRADREAALDRLAEASDSIAQPTLEALTSALRWLAPQADLGRDAERWRALLRRRLETRPESRPDLLLPRRAGETPDGT